MQEFALTCGEIFDFAHSDEILRFAQGEIKSIRNPHTVRISSRSDFTRTQ